MSEHPRDDIASGEVWPDENDPEYVEWLEAERIRLERRVADLEAQLGRAEDLLTRQGPGPAIAGAVDRLIAEEHGPPPHHHHSAPRPS